MEEAIQEEEYREIYNGTTNTVSFKNVRPSEVKANPRIILPKARHPREEAELSTRDTMVRREFKDYLQQNPEPQKTITAMEARGIPKLQKRIARGEITICQTDKSAGIAILSREIWEELGKVHTDGDMIIDWEEVKEDQKIIKGHMRCLNHVFKPGANTGNEERVWNAVQLKSTVIPLMYPLIKDHKPVQEDGRPKTRPVCGASASINGELSEYVSRVLKAVCEKVDLAEVISGEELRAMVDQLVLDLDKEDTPEHGMCVGSLDVVALYQSLVIETCARICAEQLVKSQIKFEEIDLNWATIYCALNMAPEDVIREGLADLIPRRLTKGNKPPTDLTVETDLVKNRWRWYKPPQVLH